jgi:hypothetical protein
MCRGANLLRDQSVGGASAGVEAKAELESGAMAAGEESGRGMADAPEPAETPKGTGLASWLRDVLVSVAVSAFIITFLYQPVRVEGTSMLPMLQNQDRLFINKIA